MDEGFIYNTSIVIFQKGVFTVIELLYLCFGSYIFTTLISRNFFCGFFNFDVTRIMEEVNEDVPVSHSLTDDLFAELKRTKLLPLKNLAVPDERNAMCLLLSMVFITIAGPVVR